MHRCEPTCCLRWVSCCAAALFHEETWPKKSALHVGEVGSYLPTLLDARKDLMAGVAQLDDFDQQLYKVTKGEQGQDRNVFPSFAERRLCVWSRRCHRRGGQGWESKCHASSHIQLSGNPDLWNTAAAEAFQAWPLQYLIATSEQPLCAFHATLGSQCDRA